MTVEEFLQNYGGNECVSIEGYCELWIDLEE